MGCSASQAQGPLQVEDQEVFLRQYRIGEKLGAGAFGHVAAVELREGRGKRPLAVKIMKLNSEGLRRQVRAECEIWRSLSHENLVKLHAVHMTEDRAMLVMDRCGESLLSCFMEVSKNGPRFAGTIRSVAAALEHLHSLQVVHRDVKPANILLTSDPSVAKLCDFGVSARLPKCGYFTARAGTAPFMAPEQAACERYGLSVDVWALGVCCYLGLYAELPYRGPEKSSAAFKEAVIAGAAPPFQHKRGLSVAPEAEEFARWLLNRDMLQRPTAAEVLAADFCNVVGHCKSQASQASDTTKATNTTALSSLSESEASSDSNA